MKYSDTPAESPPSVSKTGRQTSSICTEKIKLSFLKKGEWLERSGKNFIIRSARYSPNTQREERAEKALEVFETLADENLDRLGRLILILGNISSPKQICNP